jgi:hypothetical protein
MEKFGDRLHVKQKEGSRMIFIFLALMEGYAMKHGTEFIDGWVRSIENEEKYYSTIIKSTDKSRVNPTLDLASTVTSFMILGKSNLEPNVSICLEWRQQTIRSMKGDNKYKHLAFCLAKSWHSSKFNYGNGCNVRHGGSNS